MEKSMYPTEIQINPYEELNEKLLIVIFIRY